MTPVSHGKPCAGNPHARFDEGASASEEPRRKALLHKNIINIVAVAVGAMVAALSLVAGEVTPEAAQVAAENWVKISPRRMGSTFRSSSAEEMETVRNEAGRAVFHAVNLEGGGFVVTSGDTRLSPIVAFSTTGRYSGDRNSPLYALLTGQEEAVAALCELDEEIAAASGAAVQGANISCLKNVDMSPFADAELEWNSLLSPGLDGSGNFPVPVGMESREEISDVRVSPLLKTKWGQQGAWDYDSNYIPLYNCYSPVEGYPCGCVATAGAQIMYYHRAPSGSIAQFSNTCYVDGSPVTLNSIAGTFDWSNMFLEYVWWEATYPYDPFPTPPSLTQRQAVSKLTYNIGVAIGMDYNGGGSSGQGNVFVSQLKSRFGYKSGSYLWHDIDTVDRLSDYNARVADFNNALYASLDAKMPVFLSLVGTSSNGGRAEHAIVADGYGYMSGCTYVHLNVGYEGDCDLWYKMVYPDETVDITFTSCSYRRFSGIGFNIHPTLAGDIVSGRVTNSSGSPVAGATVTLCDSSDNVVKTATTDAKGIYSIRFTSAGNYKLKAASGSSVSDAVSVSLSRTVTQDLGLEFEHGGRTGNKWGVNLTLSGSAATYTVTYKPGANGSGSQQTATKTAGVALELKGAIFTRSGYTQTGWATSDGGAKVYDLGASYTANAAITLYPVWTQDLVTYIVTYKPGAYGSGSQQTATKKQSFTLVLKGAIFTRSGYTQTGWATSDGGAKVYELGDYYTKNAAITLYPFWTQNAATYKVTFGKNGGTGGDNYVTATYGSAMPTPRTAPTLSGWTFAGYWDTLALDEKGNPKGKQYYDANMKSVRAWDKNGNATLWAKWTNKVTFGKNGGTGGDSYVTCTKGQPMPKRAMPTKSGYVFDGYWTTTGAGGVKYYNADGTSAHAWDKSGSVTLWAKWVKPVACKVTFGKNGGTGGDNYVTATTGQPMPAPRTAPTKSGWTFGGYWDTLACDAKGNPLGKQYYDANMKSVRAWDKTSAATLWAKWTVRVKLGKNGGAGGDDYVTVTYNQPFPTRAMPTKSGYKFGGYFVSASSRTGQCYNADGTGTSSMKWTTGGTPTIWALWNR